MNDTRLPPSNTNGVGALPFTPILGVNAVFLTVYCILLPLGTYFAFRFWRFYGHAIGMIGGLLLELVGYVAKVQLAQNRHNKDAYIMYIIGLTLGPTFLSASLYLSISTLQRHYPAVRFTYLKPHLFATFFILGDFLSLSFIGAGGSLAAIYWWSPIGVNLMIARLATQVLFTTVFCFLLGTIYRRIRRRIMQDKRHFFILAESVAAICLLIRSGWRVAELSEGFNGPLASMEGVFIALDGIPMAIMSILLIISHPGLWFVEGQYEVKELGISLWSLPQKV